MREGRGEERRGYLRESLPYEPVEVGRQWAACLYLFAFSLSPFPVSLLHSRFSQHAFPFARRYVSARRNNFTLFPSHLPLFTFVLVLLFSVCPSAQGVPTLIGRVVDNAEILSPPTKTTITLLLETPAAETSNQLAVLPIPS